MSCPGGRRPWPYLVPLALVVVALSAVPSALPARAGGATVPRPVDLPAASVNAISCPAAGSCIALGQLLGAGMTSARPVIVAERSGRWSAAPLTSVASGGDATLRAVSCVAPGACTVVGDEPGSSGDAPVVLRDRGGSWADGGVAGLAGLELSAVSCPTSTFCALVGNESQSPDAAIFATESAAGWTPTVLNVPGATSSALQAVSCASATDCVAVGTVDMGATQQGLIVTLAGGAVSWGRAPLPRGGGSIDALDSVSCVASSCVAVGEYENHSYARGLLLSEVGGQWTASSSPQAPQVQGIYAVSCAAPGACVAVGTEGDESLDQQGLVLTDRGGRWSVALLPVPATVARAGPGFGTTLSTISCLPARCAVAGTVVGSYGARRGALWDWRP